MDNMPHRPNEAGETPVIVRWMVETPAGWLGAYNLEAFDAYAEQRCAPLVEALRNLIEAADSMRGTYGVIWGDTPEDRDTFTHDQWAEDFLKERAEEANAALAAQEQSK